MAVREREIEREREGERDGGRAKSTENTCSMNTHGLPLQYMADTDSITLIKLMVQCTWWVYPYLNHTEWLPGQVIRGVTPESQEQDHKLVTGQNKTFFVSNTNCTVLGVS